MHPHVYLESLWRLELRDEVFVAMSFDERYAERFTKVIEPACKRVTVEGRPLRARRVDLSRNGDSILTEIMDGIGHACVVLADVSIIGRDSVTSKGFRNANVLYEVGLALACRTPAEVLLVRDDDESLLFDVSSVPHLRVDFTDAALASERITQAIVERVNERRLLFDARVVRLAASMGPDEIRLFEAFRSPPLVPWGFQKKRFQNVLQWAGLARLLEKGIALRVGSFQEGEAAFAWTPMGAIVIKLALAKGRIYQGERVTPARPSAPPTSEAPPPS